MTPHNFTETTKSGSQSPQSQSLWETAELPPLSGEEEKKKKKGVLFSNSPVRGATELGLHNHTTENRKIQIKARAHAREICNKTLCQRITGEKKSNEAERTCWTTFLLTQGGRKKQNLPVLRSLKKCPRYTGAFL